MATPSGTPSRSRGSRSPVRARGPLWGDGASEPLSRATLMGATFGERLNAYAYREPSRSPPPPQRASSGRASSPSCARRGPVPPQSPAYPSLRSAQAATSFMGKLADAALSAAEARNPTPPASSRSPVVTRSNSVRKLPRPPGDVSPSTSLSPEPRQPTGTFEHHWSHGELKSIAEEERRRREAAEREAADLKKRLKLANDEVRIWKEKCDLLEADLVELKAVTVCLEDSRNPALCTRSLAADTDASFSIVQAESLVDETRATKIAADAAGFHAFGRSNIIDEPMYEQQFGAIEAAIDKLHVQKSAMTNDLELIRQRMLATLEVGLEETTVAPLSGFTAAGKLAGGLGLAGLSSLPASSPRGSVPPAMSPRDVGQMTPRTRMMAGLASQA